MFCYIYSAFLFIQDSPTTLSDSKKYSRKIQHLEFIFFTKVHTRWSLTWVLVPRRVQIPSCQYHQSPQITSLSLRNRFVLGIHGTLFRARPPFLPSTPLQSNKTQMVINCCFSKQQTFRSTELCKYARCRCLLVPGSWSWLCSTPQTVVTQMYSPTKRITRNRINSTVRTKKNSDRMLWATATDWTWRARPTWGLD